MSILDGQNHNNWIVLAIGWLLLTFYALFLANNLLNLQFIVM
jgi:hypothetical protein